MNLALGASSFKGQPVHTCHVGSPARLLRPTRLPFSVVAQKKGKKTQQVVLTQDLPGTGVQGELTTVSNGFCRNYLYPQRMAMPATARILEQIQSKIDSDKSAAMKVQSQAQAMATALSTIGKFIIKKKAGEKDQIFGSVTTQEVVEAIAQQTGRTLPKDTVDLPEIKSLGSYDVSIRLHPNVQGKFKVVVQKAKNE